MPKQRFYPTCLLSLIFLFAVNLSLGQANAEMEKDLRRINRMLKTKKKVSALIDFSRQYYATHPEKAIETANDALQLAWGLNFKEGVSDAYRSLGMIYLDQMDYPEARENLMKFIELGGNKPPTEKAALEELARAYRDVGRTYMAENNLSEGVNFYEKSLSLSFKNADTLSAANIIFLIGRAHLMAGDYEKASLEFDRALPLAESADDLTLSEQIIRAKENADNILEGYLQTEKYQAKTEELTEKYSIVQDSLEREQRERERLASERDLLQARNALAEAEIRRKTEEKRFFMGLSFMAVLMVGFLLYWYIKKREWSQKLAQSNRDLRKEKETSDELLLNILPAETAEELKRTGKAEARSYDQVTVLFTDFLGFTSMAENMSPRDLVAELHKCFEAFDTIIEKSGVEKIKTIGDAYMCAGGLPVADQENAEKTVRAALEIQAFMNSLKQERETRGEPYFEARLGIHTGPVIAGIVGIKKFSYDIWGDTVNTAARMESSGEVGKVNISASTYELIKEKFDCTPRGKIHAKNKGEIDMFFVEGVKADVGMRAMER